MKWVISGMFIMVVTMDTIQSYKHSNVIVNYGAKK